MRKFLFLILFIFPQIVDAASLASQVEAKYNSLKSWQADFSQTTYVEMLKQKLSKKGKIAVARPNQLRIEYQSVPQKIYASNGKKLWIYKQDDLTAWQFSKPKKVISQEALSFLSGLKNMSNIFDVVTDLKDPKGYLKIQDSSLKKLYLIPKKRDAVLKIVLGVDLKSLVVKEAVLFNTSGNVTHYAFKGVQFDLSFAEGYFELPKTPKRKIIRK